MKMADTSYALLMGLQTLQILLTLVTGLFLLTEISTLSRKLSLYLVNPLHVSFPLSSASKTPASSTTTTTSTSPPPSDNDALTDLLSKQLRGLADLLATLPPSAPMRSLGSTMLGRCFEILASMKRTGCRSSTVISASCTDPDMSLIRQDRILERFVPRDYEQTPSLDRPSLSRFRTDGSASSTKPTSTSIVHTSDTTRTGLSGMTLDFDSEGFRGPSSSKTK